MVRSVFAPPPPPPMPDVQVAQCYLPDAINALNRAASAWNRAQFEDALRSARLFIDLAEKDLIAAQ